VDDDGTVVGRDGGREGARGVHDEHVAGVEEARQVRDRHVLEVSIGAVGHEEPGVVPTSAARLDRAVSDEIVRHVQVEQPCRPVEHGHHATSSGRTSATR
jgi:hypothetical protein